MKPFRYPLSGDAAAKWELGALLRAHLWVKSLAPHRGPNRHADAIKLTPLSGRCSRPLKDSDFPLIFLSRNDMRLLPSFLAHYRSLGVSRFICVDDRSEDGTRDHLLKQEDVDLYSSNVRFKDADRGQIWRARLLARYGIDRWYLTVDSDEYLVYETMDGEGIAAYARRLETRGIRRLGAPMLDLYPVGGLASAIFDGSDETMPWEVATHLDGDGYQAGVSSNGISLRGGVRARVFGSSGQLMKYPLVRWDRRCAFGRSLHRPRPALYNFAPGMAVLLHFKFFSDWKDRVKQAIEGGQHSHGAILYQIIAENAAGRTDMDLGYAGSIPYAGVADLIEKGFMLPALR
jgi:hypothetical protein